MTCACPTVDDICEEEDPGILERERFERNAPRLAAALSSAIYAFDQLAKAWQGKLVRDLDECFEAVESARKLVE